MTGQFTKSQVDRLGDRLRSGKYKESDLVFLDDYRKSFHEIYDTTVKTIRGRANLDPTGRPAKSTTAIIEKLKRESIRLSQIQDIAGCRIVIDTIIKQNEILPSLVELFPNTIIVDRRLHPSHGYRGVHIIVNVKGQAIEIQVRSLLQHLWAEFSEKVSDVLDPSIKYGGGEEDIKELLQESTLLMTRIEDIELENMYLEENKSDSIDQWKLKKLQEELAQVKKECVDSLSKCIEIF